MRVILAASSHPTAAARISHLKQSNMARSFSFHKSLTKCLQNKNLLPNCYSWYALDLLVLVDNTFLHVEQHKTASNTAGLDNNTDTLQWIGLKTKASKQCNIIHSMVDICLSLLCYSLEFVEESLDGSLQACSRWSGSACFFTAGSLRLANRHPEVLTGDSWWHCPVYETGKLATDSCLPRGAINCESKIAAVSSLVAPAVAGERARCDIASTSSLPSWNNTSLCACTCSQEFLPPNRTSP